MTRNMFTASLSRSTAIRSTSRNSATACLLSARAVSNIASPYRLPEPRNEPNLDYVKGSSESKALRTALDKLRSRLPVVTPAYISGQAHTASQTVDQCLPSEHGVTFTKWSPASADQVSSAIEAALQAKIQWQKTPFIDRAAIFLKAAELVAGKYRHDLVAATMLGQGKNPWQAEIDAAAELADFFRFNVAFAQEILERQPTKNAPGNFGRLDYRPLEGFVYAISPFNFTAIGGNLISGPALMGNVVLWKPSPSAIYSSWLVYQILLEAGLPPSVIQFVPGDAELVTKTIFAHKDFAGLNFTGSSDVFRSLWARAAQGTADKTYREYPRMVGETSGKNFHLVHSSADMSSAVNHTVRASFEYSGQKCSACSRIYLPQSVADSFLNKLKAQLGTLKIGPPDEFETFLGPVINQASFDRITSTIDAANKDPDLTCIAGGSYDGSTGFYVEPTVYVSKSGTHELFDRELFGPVLVVYVYPDEDFDKILQVVDKQGGGFALTGSIFAADRNVIRQAEDTLRYAAGNFYINCKTTAAVIGHTSFGGSRSSGTNDKAGSSGPIVRFTNARSIKEEFIPADKVLYPHNENTHMRDSK